VWLRVFVVDDARGDAAPHEELMDWAIEWKRPDVTPVVGPIVMDWAHGGRSSTDASALAGDRRGGEFWQLWASANFLVYVHGRQILSFGAVRRRDTGELLMYVGEHD